MTREELYRKFGPMLAEAVVLVVEDEINILRSEAGLPLRSDQYITDAIDNKLESLDKYDWMG